MTQVPHTQVLTRRGLGSDIELVLVLKPSEVVPRSLLAELSAQIDDFEARFSRFLDVSELSHFNRMAGQKVAVSDEFRALLEAVIDMIEQTDGLYNPFILPALQRAGYVHSMAVETRGEQLDDHRKKAVADARKLKLTDGYATIPYGTAIDFGGIGKGSLADQLATYAEPYCSGFWLALGGDIACFGANERGESWQVAVQSANDLGSDVATMAMPKTRSAIATSGTLKRLGTTNGTHWHHIIDPTTKRPVDTDVAMATVCATSATDADVYAKMAILVGSKQAPDYLRDHGISDALLQIGKQAPYSPICVGDAMLLMPTPRKKETT